MSDFSENIHPEELKGTGLCPRDFELVGGTALPKFVQEHGYHPDDQHREYEMERHDGK